MKATITIDMDGAAFAEAEERYGARHVASFELPRLLEDLAEDIRGGCRVRTIRDSNGNTCGRFEITDD
jgi:hypothetical protein